MTQDSIIQKHVLSVTCYGVQDNDVLFGKLESIVRKDLLPAIEYTINKTVRDQFIKTDTIELNIGAIRRKDLETGLVAKVCGELEKQLKELQQRQPLLYNGKDSDMKAGISATEIIKHYLITGTLPWWASHKYRCSIDDLLKSALVADVQNFRAMLFDIGKKEAVRKRIAFALSHTVILDVIKTIDTANYHIIISYTNALNAAQERENPVLVNDSDFSQLKWYFVLNYLLVERGNYFNKRIFIRSLIRQISGHYAIPYGKLIARLINVFVPLEAAGHSSLRSLLKDIYTEDKRYGLPGTYSVDDVDHADPGSETSEFYKDGSGIRFLFTYLFRKGRLPKEYEKLSKHELQKLAERYIKRADADGFISLLQKSALLQSPFLLASLFSIRELTLLIAHITVSAHHDQIRTIAEGIEQNITRKRSTTGIRYHFSEIIWHQMLITLLDYRGKPFQLQNFTGNLLSRISNTLQTKIVIWLSPLAWYTPSPLLNALPQLRSQNISGLSLVAASSTLRRSTISDIKKASIALTTDIESTEYYLFRFLSQGNVPMPKRLEKKVNWAGWLRKSFKKDKQRILARLIAMSGDIASLERFVALADEKIINELFFFTTHQHNIKLFSSTSRNLTFTAQNSGFTAVKLFLALYFIRLYQNRQPISSEQTKNLISQIAQRLSIQENIIIGALFSLFQNNKSLNKLPDARLLYLTVHDLLTTAKQKQAIRQSAQPAPGPGKEKEIWEDISFYLLHGRLPWWTIGITVPTIARFLIHQSRKNNQQVLSFLRPLLRRPAVAGRLFRLFDDRNFIIFLESLNAGSDVSVFYKTSLLKKSTYPQHIAVSLLLLLSLSYKSKDVSSTRSFLQSTLVDISFLSRLPYLRVLHHLASIASAVQNEGIQSSLAGGLILLEAEQPFKLRSGSAADLPAITKRTFIHLLSYYELPEQSGFSNVEAFLLSISAKRIQWFADTAMELLSNPLAVKRASAAFNNRVLLLLLKIITGKWNSILFTITKQLYHLSLQAKLMDKERISAVLWVSAIDHLASRKTVSAESYTAALIHSIIKQSDNATSFLHQTTEMINSGQIRFLGLIRAAIYAKSQEIKTLAHDTEKDIAEEVVPYIQYKPEESTGIDDYINNAGLVILSPYFDRLFQELNLLSPDGIFRTFTHQVKAIQLMHFMVTGTDELFEFDAALSKVMCGIDIAEPVTVFSVLSEEEKELSLVLLRSVIQNWSIIGNTTIEGLRETFLIRFGKLVCKEDSFTLMVEKRPFDMLLKQLPWSFSLIRKKWMTKPLYTIWE